MKFLLPILTLSIYLSVGLFLSVAVQAQGKTGSKAAGPQGVELKVLTHTQFMSLSSQQKREYILIMREMMLQMASKTNFFVDNKKFNRWSLFPQAWAQEQERLRCVNGGFPVRGEHCRFTEITLKIGGEEKTLSCGSGLRMCYPLFYGLREDNEPLCLRASNNHTVNCNRAAPNPDAKLNVLIDENKGLYDKSHKDLQDICADPQGTTGQRQGIVVDIIQTCKATNLRLDRFDPSRAVNVAEAGTSPVEPGVVVEGGANSPSVGEGSQGNGPGATGGSELASAGSGENCANVMGQLLNHSKEGAHRRSTESLRRAHERAAAGAGPRVSEPVPSPRKVDPRWMSTLDIASHYCRNMSEQDKAALQSLGITRTLRSGNEMVETWGYCRQAEGDRFNEENILLAEAIEKVKKGEGLSPGQMDAFVNTYNVSPNGLGLGLLCSQDRHQLITAFNRIENNTGRPFRTQFRSCLRESVDAEEVHSDFSSNEGTPWIAGAVGQIRSRYSQNNCQTMEWSSWRHIPEANQPPFMLVDKTTGQCHYVTRVAPSSGMDGHYIVSMEGSDTGLMLQDSDLGSKYSLKSLSCQGDGVATPPPNPRVPIGLDSFEGLNSSGGRTTR